MSILLELYYVGGNKMKNLYRLIRQGNITRWVECNGSEVKVEGYILYYVKDIDFGYTFSNCLIEPRSGLAVGKGRTKQLCIEDFKNNLRKYGYERYNEIITEMIEKYGESPLYQNNYK